MSNFLPDFSSLEVFYAICAFVGGVLFVLRLGMSMIFGFDHGADVPHDVGLPMDTVPDGADLSHGVDSAFQLFSFQGLVGFFTIFGLAGLTLTKQFNVGDGASALGAFVAGFGTMLVLAQLVVWTQALRSSGNVDVRNAIGQSGTVYLSIPASGTGQVQIAVQERLRIYDAIAADKQPISTGERVRVTEIFGSNTLVVEKV